MAKFAPTLRKMRLASAYTLKAIPPVKKRRRTLRKVRRNTRQTFKQYGGDDKAMFSQLQSAYDNYIRAKDAGEDTKQLKGVLTRLNLTLNFQNKKDKGLTDLKSQIAALNVVQTPGRETGIRPAPPSRRGSFSGNSATKTVLLPRKSQELPTTLSAEKVDRSTRSFEEKNARPASTAGPAPRPVPRPAGPVPRPAGPAPRPASTAPPRPITSFKQTKIPENIGLLIRKDASSLSEQDIENVINYFDSSGNDEKKEIQQFLAQNKSIFDGNSLLTQDIKNRIGDAIEERVVLGLSNSPERDVYREQTLARPIEERKKFREDIITLKKNTSQLKSVEEFQTLDISQQLDYLRQIADIPSSRENLFVGQNKEDAELLYKNLTESSSQGEGAEPPLNLDDENDKFDPFESPSVQTGLTPLINSVGIEKATPAAFSLDDATPEDAVESGEKLLENELKQSEEEKLLNSPTQGERDENLLGNAVPPAPAVEGPAVEAPDAAEQITVETLQRSNDEYQLANPARKREIATTIRDNMNSVQIPADVREELQKTINTEFPTDVDANPAFVPAELPDVTAPAPPAAPHLAPPLQNDPTAHDETKAVGLTPTQEAVPAPAPPGPPLPNVGSKPKRAPPPKGVKIPTNIQAALPAAVAAQADPVKNVKAKIVELNGIVQTKVNSLTEDPVLRATLQKELDALPK